VNGWFCGVDETDYAGALPGEFRHLDARDLTLEALGLDEPVDLVSLPPCQAYARPSHVHYDDPKAVFPTFEDLGVRDSRGSGASTSSKTSSGVTTSETRLS